VRLSRLERNRDIRDISSRTAVPPPTSVLDPRRRWPRALLGAGVVVLIAVIAFAALAFVWSRPSIVADAAALARVDLPITRGAIESVRAVGPNGREIPVTVRDGRLWPLVSLAPGEQVTVEVVLRRPGWIAWLAGRHTSERLQLHTPSAIVNERYVTLAAGSPLQLAFNQPVRTLAYGPPEHLQHRTLSSPRSQVTLARSGEAGSIEVAATPRSWERLPAPSLVTWFPAGSGPSAVVSPSPGSRIAPTTPIYVTFSQPLSTALNGQHPRLEPAASGHWRTVDSHTIAFIPSGYGFGLDTPVTLQLPHAVRLLGGQHAQSSSVASWTVPEGSIVRAQQILAQLGYLPLSFTPTHHVALTAAAQERAAVDPPAGSFSWRYGNVPAQLNALWRPGTTDEMMRGAVMAFESAHELTIDGLVGPAVWRALLHAEIARQQTTAGYTFVMVSEGSESLALWNDGSIRLTTPVNTGIATAPTELGTFAVYEHIASGTMSGTNPDGSHYEDPGIPWISYFNGGDALHGFERAQYGFPQSLGCVEMPPATAGRVWPYTPIGTLVHIE
jgi:peptidoglycan hydrolase-like protein with peptidoglycan-binding domain